MISMDNSEKEKEVMLREHLKTMQPGEPISHAYIQREIRVGHAMAKTFLTNLHEKGFVESYTTWVGSLVNGVRKDGQEITLYRIAVK